VKGVVTGKNLLTTTSGAGGATDFTKVLQKQENFDHKSSV